VRYNTFNRNNATALTKGIAAIDRGVALSSYEHAIHNNTFNMNTATSGNIVEAYSGTADVYAWDNTRNPSGGNYNSGVTVGCCPPWYNPGGGGTCNAPGSLSTSGITASAVTFNWGSVSGASNYDLRYRVNGTTTWTNVNDRTGTSYTQSGLTASTTYQWEIRTDCGSTQSGYVAGSNFTTSSSSGGGSTTVVYADALATDWNDYSYTGTYNFANTTPVQVGSNSIKATYGGWGGVNIKKGTDLNVSGFTSIRFWVQGEGSYLIRLRLSTNLGNKDYEFTTTTSWQQITVTLSSLGSPSTVESITLQSRSATSGRVVYYDQIEFVGSGSLQTDAPTALVAGNAQFKVYPNPVQNRQLQLELARTGWTGEGTLLLQDLQGRTLWQERIAFDPKLTVQPVTLPTHLATGVYLLRVQNAQTSLQQRIIVQ
jgi:hypothetical protein